MTLRELLTVLPDNPAVTLHRNGQRDDHYLYASDIESENMDMEVIEINKSYCPKRTDWFIWIETPIEKDLIERLEGSFK